MNSHYSKLYKVGKEVSREKREKKRKEVSLLSFCLVW